MTTIAKPKERWDNDERGQLYDVVVPDVACFRLERMDNNFWWIGLYRQNGTLIHVDIVAKKSGMIAIRRED